ncbi:hypothetical protein AAFF_G00354430 [Aldrovandia affinis]|uniref:Uncharacterized protein n=1 Tax=Aldrovandia affinis TaxID=143900 RepID=A0AAD7WN69_9TELE|nr:hypothetical protein AAFF_G00354430 [Aldrovandia affinis]
MLTKLKELKETAQEAEYEEESDDEVTPDDTIVSSYNTAKRIRMELQDQHKAEKQALKAAREARSSSASETEYPSMQLEISYLEASRRVSCNLYNHLAWLITDASPEVGDDSRVKVSPKQHEQVLNLAQDVCQTVAGIPTPKHIGTALHILKETRSKATVTLLNRFGNCISYQDAQRYITTMAKSVDEQTGQDGTFIPTNLKVGRFTQFAFDNLDFQEYTKDGRTLHGTTHIIFQYKDPDEDPTPMASLPLLKTRQSSLDIMVEADVCLRGTANKIISGKDYYTMLHAHTIVHAAMFALHWEVFTKWLITEEKDLERISVLAINVQLLLDALSEMDVEKASSACADATNQLKELSRLMAEFDEVCTSPTTKLWLMYMDMVMILKRFIHAEHAGLWEEHLAEVEKMLPYLVAAGHYKYVSCLPHYLEEMRSLPTLAPNIHREFKDGKFTVRQTEGCFNGVWTDMALEKTYIRDAKTKLFNGISQQLAAMEKYLRALPVLTAVSEQTKAMAHLDMDDTKHQEDSNSQGTKEAERKITDVINNQMINPFSCEEQELMNISTGHKSASADLVNAREKGLEALAAARKTDRK